MNAMKTILLTVVVIFAAVWVLGSDSSDFKVVDSVPAGFRGTYVKMFVDQPGDLWPYEEKLSVELIRLEASQIGIRKHGEWEFFEVQRLHQATDGALIVFYGRPHEHHIAEYRRQFVPRANELLEVDQILTPWGDDLYMRIGTFQLVEHYAGALKP